MILGCQKRTYPVTEATFTQLVTANPRTPVIKDGPRRSIDVGGRRFVAETERAGAGVA